MSILAIAFFGEGIAMASDSRMTRHVTDGRDITHFSGGDDARKLLMLKKCPAAIAFCGNMYYNNDPVVSFLQRFERDELRPGDTPKTVAEKLEVHHRAKKETVFYVCGYERDEPYIYLLDATGMRRYNVTADGARYYGLAWAGELTALNKLINGAPAMKLNYEYMTLKDGLELVTFMVHTTIQYQRFSDGPANCGGPIDMLGITPYEMFWYRNKLLPKTT